jgi:hypothetical protein
MYGQGFGEDFDIDPIINYYSFSQGQQMVELDYFSAYKNRGSQLNSEQPRALNWNSVIGNPPENVYLFRNSQGRILKRFGQWPSDIQLLSVKKSLEICKPHHHRSRTMGSKIGNPVFGTRFYPYYLIGKQVSYGKGTLGLIDSLGNFVLPRKYDVIVQAKEYFIMQSGDLYEIRDNNLKIKYSTKRYRLQPSNDLSFILATKDDLQGLLNTEGDIVIPVKYRALRLPFNKNGLMEVQNKEGFYGFVNRKGKEVISCKYQNFGDFTDGLISAKKNDKRGFIDVKGKTVIPFKYDHAFWFVEGFARVSKRIGNYYHFGYIDKQGNEIIPLKYASATDFENGYAWVRLDFPEDRNQVKIYRSYKELKDRKGIGKWVKIDKSGKIVE